jgi:hypothetical protein
VSRHAGKAFIAGAKDPGLSEHGRFEPAAPVEAALTKAEAIHSRDSRVVYAKYQLMVNRQ